MHQRVFIICALALAAAGPAGAGRAHQHGVATLDIAVGPGRVSITLQAPLDNLLGFERAPRTDAERQRADAALARLRAASQMFRIDPAAGCTVAAVELASAALKLGSTGDAQARDEHADLDGQFDFNCKDGRRAAFVEVGLFEAFESLRRLEVQVATPRGQMKATLLRPAARVALVR